MRRSLLIWCALGLGGFASVALALVTGSANVSPLELLGVGSAADSLAHEVITRLRLPRALAAFATGGLLALAGALMQVLLRNPLADPYVLGLSGGSAVGALGALLAGFGTLLVNVCAASGAFFSLVIVFVLARRDFSRQHLLGVADPSPRLLLTGVIVAAAWSAIVMLMLAVAPEAKLRGMVFWLMGDLNGIESWVPAFAVLAACLALACPIARDLNVMLRGDALAYALGVRVERRRRSIYLLASAATALAVTTAGTIGFVGLVVPHALRLAFGNDQRVLLPASALAGGMLLVLADTAARSVVAPQQLPVGVITALVGVPTFLALLLRAPRRA